MSVSGCGDASTISGAAAELFQLAALLMGDTTEAVSLVEETVAAVEMDPCVDPVVARRVTVQQLVEGGVARLRETDAASFEGKPAVGAAAVCVEEDDLSAAGISQGQLVEWLASEGRGDLRAWLAALPGAPRAIFVQRAVLGRDNAATAETLHESAKALPGKFAETRHGGAALPEEATGWTPEAVGEVYRQALCSLANSLAHAQGAVGEAGVAVAAHA